MNILFLFQKFSFQSSTIYLDLVDACRDAGHQVYVVAGTSEKVDASRMVEERGCKVVYVPLPDQFKSGKIKKGLVQLAIEPIFLSRMKKYMWNEKIDLIAYPTPPITLAGVVKAAKKHYHAKTYLMLKDIFPQNAADLQMMGEKSPVFKYFKGVEKKLYRVSDRIGCMSEANVEYMRAHLPKEMGERLELFPNTVKVMPFENPGEDRENGPVRFVFGGNLGKPQAIDFLLEGIKALSDYADARFLIIGDGTEAKRVEKFLETNALPNAEYHKQLPRDEYEAILGKQDIGLILLSPAFTIPNFPSRLLSYMQKGKPVFAVTDRVSDIGKIVSEDAGCGFFAPSDDLAGFVNSVKEICGRRDELAEMGKRGYEFLSKNYSVEISVRLLEDAMKK